MRDFLQLMAPALKVAKERHDDPKNVSKGDYPKDLFKLWQGWEAECKELTEELIKDATPDVLSRMRYECGDVLLTTAMLLVKIEAMLQGEPYHEG